MQFGARASHSATDAALVMIDQIQKRQKQGLKTSSFFMDVKGAFNHVVQARLLATMAKKGIPPKIIHWVRHFLSSRTVALAFNGQTGPDQDVEVGIPQGSPVSPILFNIYLSPLFEHTDRIVQKEGTSSLTISYVDDIQFIVASESFAQNCRIIEACNNFTQTWGKASGVAFDDVKKDLIHWKTARETTTATVGIRVQDREFTPQAFVKWLGIYFDTALNWQKHIKVRGDLLVKAWNVFRNNCRETLGIPPATIKTLYKTCVEPVFTWGACAWYNGSRAQTKRLATIQTQAAIKYNSGVRWSPRFAAQVEAAMPPACVTIGRLLRREKVRILLLPDNHALRTTAFQDKWQRPPKNPIRRVLSMHPEINAETLENFIHNEVHPPRAAKRITAKAGTTYSNKEAEASNHYRCFSPSEDGRKRLRIYTQGAMAHGTAGAAAVAYQGNQVIATRHEHLRREMDQTAISLVGIELAIGIIDDMELGTNRENETIQRLDEIHIFSDDNVAVNTLLDYRPQTSQYIRLRIKAKLDRMMCYMNGTFHIKTISKGSKIAGAEAAKRMAETAASIPQPINARRHPISRSCAYRMVDEETLAAWDRYSKECRSEPKQGHSISEGYRPYWDAAPRLRMKPWPWHKKATRSEISAIFQIKTNKGYFGDGYFSRPGEDPELRNCRHCDNTTESILHMVRYCPAYTNQRRILNRSIRPTQSLGEVINNDDARAALLKYVKDTGILNRGTFQAYRTERLAEIQRRRDLDSSTESEREASPEGENEPGHGTGEDNPTLLPRIEETDARDRDLDNDSQAILSIISTHTMVTRSRTRLAVNDMGDNGA